MQIGIVGKPNTGKSTFFAASTLVDVEIGNRPFVTIKPNQGVSFITTKCVHLELGKDCQPQNSKCTNGIRQIPITLLDVAGLVPDAWRGKGLGNQFLNDLIGAQALIHVLDLSGGTDIEGNPVKIGSHNPAEDVLFLENEISQWVRGILTKNWEKISKTATATKKPVESLAGQLSGLGISENNIKSVFEKSGFPERLVDWNEEQILEFSKIIRGESKPILVAANKMDIANAKENLEKLKKEFPEKIFVPCCAEAELALRKADREGLISYIPGEKTFKILKEELPEQKKKALNFIQEKILNEFGSTGVQDCINRTAFELLDLIVLYPVEDQHKWTSGKGHVIPDAHLIKNGATALDLAAKIHSSFGERFVAAIDCRTGQKIGKETRLKNNDVVKIQLRN